MRRERCSDGRLHARRGGRECWSGRGRGDLIRGIGRRVGRRRGGWR